MPKYSKLYRQKHMPLAKWRKRIARTRPDGKVKCRKCRRWKSSHLFYKQSNHTTPYQSHCKNCDRARQRSEYTVDRRRRKRLKIEYDMTEQDYQALLIKQDYKCLICFVEKNKDTSTGKLAVDHDHNTGSVRGLLCGNCNKAIGLLSDDPRTARRLAEYLEGGIAT